MSKLLRQNIEKYSILNVSGVIANQGLSIQTQITFIRFLEYTRNSFQLSAEYDREVSKNSFGFRRIILSVFGFSRSLFGFDKKFRHWWDELYQQREKDIEAAKTEL